MTATRSLRYAAPVVQLAATALAVAAMLFLTLPRVLGWQGVVVLSGSMAPAMPVGAVAFVDRTAVEDIEAGDILTFTRGDRQVTHRVVEVVASPEGVTFRTKGDANNAPDAALVTPDRVVGTVRLTIPRLGGFAQTVAHHRALLGVVMGGAAAVLIAGDLRRRRTVAPAT